MSLKPAAAGPSLGGHCRFFRNLEVPVIDEISKRNRDNVEVNDYALRVRLVITTDHVYTKLASLQSEGHLLSRQVEEPTNMLWT